MKSFSALLLAALLLAAAPARAKTLVFCSEGDPESLNPQVTTSMTGINAAEPMFDGLVRFEVGTGAILPGLARSWTVAPDGRAYTFDLREGVKFHANARFTPTRAFDADDVIFSFERQKRADNPFHTVVSGTFDYFDDMGFGSLVEGIDRLGDHRVRFRLARPSAPFLADLGMPFAKILSAEYAGALLEAGTPDRLDAEPIGTGPFAFESYSKDQTIRYRAFPDHWNGKPPIDVLVFAITPNAVVRLAKVKAGECQIMSFPAPADAERIAREPALELLSQQGFNIGYMTMNASLPPFDDARVRRAVNMAVDKEALIRAVYGRLGVAIKNPLPPGLWSYDDDVPAYPYDPDAARRLMVEAGHGDGFSVDMWYLPLTRAYNPDGRRVAEMVAADLSRIGIETRLMTAPWRDYRNNVLAGARGIAFYGWTTDNGDPDNFLGLLLGCQDGRPVANNVAKWCDPEFERLVALARATTDRAERERLYRAAQVVAHDQAPWVPIATGVDLAVVRREVRNFRLDPFGRFMFDAVDVEGR